MNPDLTPTSVTALGAILTLVLNNPALRKRVPVYYTTDTSGNLQHPHSCTQAADDEHWVLIFPSPISLLHPLHVGPLDPGLRSTITAAPCLPAGYVVPGNYTIT